MDILFVGNVLRTIVRLKIFVHVSYFFALPVARTAVAVATAAAADEDAAAVLGAVSWN